MEYKHASSVLILVISNYLMADIYEVNEKWLSFIKDRQIDWRTDKQVMYFLRKSPVWSSNIHKSVW